MSLMRRHAANLTQQQSGKLALYFDHHPAVAAIYELREQYVNYCCYGTTMPRRAAASRPFFCGTSSSCALPASLHCNG